jgi:hypothetical protein
MALMVVSASAKERTGFDGKWKLDTKSSNMGQAPDGLSQEIKTDGSQVVVRSKYMEPKTAVYPLSMVGIMTGELKLNTDGSETKNNFGPFVHVSKTTMEGNKMTTDWTAATDKGQVTGKWVRTLSEDGRKLTMEVHSSEPGGQSHDSTLVFVRK